MEPAITERSMANMKEGGVLAPQVLKGHSFDVGGLVG